MASRFAPDRRCVDAAATRAPAGARCERHPDRTQRQADHRQHRAPASPDGPRRSRRRRGPRRAKRDLPRRRFPSTARWRAISISPPRAAASSSSGRARRAGLRGRDDGRRRCRPRLLDRAVGGLQRLPRVAVRAGRAVLSDLGLARRRVGFDKNFIGAGFWEDMAQPSPGHDDDATRRPAWTRCA